MTSRFTARARCTCRNRPWRASGASRTPASAWPRSRTRVRDAPAPSPTSGTCATPRTRRCRRRPVTRASDSSSTLRRLLLGCGFLRRLLGATRRDARRFARHLGIHGRPRRVGEARREVALVHREEGFERLEVVVDGSPGIAGALGAGRHGCDRERVDFDRVKLVPRVRCRDLPAGTRPRRPRPEHGLVRRALVEVDEHAPPRSSFHHAAR